MHYVLIFLGNITKRHFVYGIQTILDGTHEMYKEKISIHV